MKAHVPGWWHPCPSRFRSELRRRGSTPEHVHGMPDPSKKRRGPVDSEIDRLLGGEEDEGDDEGTVSNVPALRRQNRLRAAGGADAQRLDSDRKVRVQRPEAV